MMVLQKTAAAAFLGEHPCDHRTIMHDGGGLGQIPPPKGPTQPPEAS